METPLAEAQAIMPVPGEKQGILTDLAVPFFLFSLFLTGCLLAVQSFVLPRLTQVEVAGTVHQGNELHPLKASLVSGIQDLEKKRDQLLLPLQEPPYDALKARRSGVIPFDAVRTQIERQALALSGQPDAVHIDSLRYQPGQKSVEVSGDVRFVGTRSMTLLAQFANMVSKLSLAASVTQPRFVREVGPAGPHSPFTFSLHLP